MATDDEKLANEGEDAIDPKDLPEIPDDEAAELTHDVPESEEG